jgi:hypothetical protein
MVAGGWHGGWALTPIARKLRAHGHEVFTPTLTGLGERSHLAGAAINLESVAAPLHLDTRRTPHALASFNKPFA